MGEKRERLHTNLWRELARIIGGLVLGGGQEGRKYRSLLNEQNEGK